MTFLLSIPPYKCSFSATFFLKKNKKLTQTDIIAELEIAAKMIDNYEKCIILTAHYY